MKSEHSGGIPSRRMHHPDVRLEVNPFVPLAVDLDGTSAPGTT
jgi:hypothetical protein